MRESIVGVWNLVSHIHLCEDGSQFSPYGEKPVGRLVYAQSGHMIVTIMDPRRPRFDSAGLFSGSDAEKVAAINGFLAYSGTYTVKENKVFHEVDISLFPNWVATTQERNINLKGDLLELSSNPFKGRSGRTETAIIQWRRISQ